MEMKNSKTKKSEYVKIIEELKKFFKNAERIAVVGVGQECRQDDAVGIITVERLYKELSGSFKLPLSISEKNFCIGNKIVKFFIGAETPESLTGKIRKFKATHVLFIDAAQLARTPGEMELVPLAEIQGEKISTHNIPLSLLGKFLELDMGCKTLLLGIQPKDMGILFERKLSEVVDKAASKAASAVRDALIGP